MGHIIHLDATINKNELILTWDVKGDYHSGITFEWRNLLINMKVDIYTTWKSTRNMITINLNGESSCFGAGRSSGGGGLIGKQPQIETPTNYLLISQRENIVIIKDNTKDVNTEVFEDDCIFKIINIPSTFDFVEPETAEDKIEIFKSRIKRDEITLYEYKGNRIDINSYAYFEKENLVVDYWKLGSNYEDEYFIIVLKNELHLLYKVFEINYQNKEELLIVLFNVFNGENSYTSFKEFLLLCRIPFENRGRHD